MSAFQIVPPLHDFELPESFISRLAAINLVGSVHELCDYVGLGYEKFHSGDPDTVAQLAEMCGIAPAALTRYKVARSKNFSVMNGQKVRSDHLIRTRARYCAACVCDDIENGHDTLEARAFQRFWWWYEPVTHCPDHGCRLSESDEQKGHRFSIDFAAYLRDRLNDVKAEARAAGRVATDPFESYVHRRLTGLAQDARPLLDEVPLHVVVTFCDAVGRLSTIGHREKAVWIRDRDRQAYRSKGYEIVAGGRDAFLGYLAERVRGAANARGLSKRNKYGIIYDRLTENLGSPEWEPLVQLIRDDALATIALGAGEEVLGYVLPRRRIHSLHSAHVESGIHPKTIRKLLLNRGVLSGDIRKESYNAVVFEVEKVTDILEKIQGSVITADAAKRLGVPKKTLHTFRDAGLVRAIGTDDVFGHSWQRYVASDVEKVLAAVESIKVVGEVPQQYAPLSKSHFLAKESAGVVLKMVIEGGVRALRLRGNEMLSTVQFHVEDARSKTQLAAHGGLTANQAAKHLGTRFKTIERLRAEGYLRSETRRHHRTRREGVYFDQAQLDEFSARHVGLYALARDLGIKIDRLMHSLSENGVEPIFEPGPDEARFYRRDQVQAFVDNPHL